MLYKITCIMDWIQHGISHLITLAMSRSWTKLRSLKSLLYNSKPVSLFNLYQLVKKSSFWQVWLRAAFLWHPTCTSLRFSLVNNSLYTYSHLICWCFFLDFAASTSVGITSLDFSILENEDLKRNVSCVCVVNTCCTGTMNQKLALVDCLYTASLMKM